MSLKEQLEALAEKYDIEVEEDSTEVDLEDKELEELPECVCELTSVEELFLDKVRRMPHRHRVVRWQPTRDQRAQPRPGLRHTPNAPEGCRRASSECSLVATGGDRRHGGAA